MHDSDQLSPEPSLEDALADLEDGDLLGSIAGIRPGDHVCVLYESSPAEQMPAVAAYIREGLAAGEQCIYLADETPVAVFEQALAVEGIDVTAEQARGSLMVWTRERWRQPGRLDSIRKAAQVREIVDLAFAAGFKAVRFAVEMTWTLKPDIPAAAIEDWEATATRAMNAGLPVSALCLYGRKRLPADTVAAGLRTHPLLLDTDGIRPNDVYAD